MSRFRIETQGNSTFLGYILQDGEKIDEFDYGMMRNNSIKGLLPAVFSEVNGQCTIKYNITSKVTLERFLDGEITKETFLIILKKFQQIFQDMQEYMLTTDHLCLEYDNIFIDMHKLDVSMILLPVSWNQETQDIKHFFRTLFFRVRYKKDEDIRYIIQLVNYLNSQYAFSLEQFGKMLEDVQASSGSKVSVREEIEINRPILRQPAAQSPMDIPERSNGKEEESNKKRGFFRSKDKGESKKIQRNSNLKDEKGKRGKTQEPIAPGFRIPGVEEDLTERSTASESREQVGDKTDKKRKGFSLLGNRKKEASNQGKMEVPSVNVVSFPSEAPMPGYVLDKQGRMTIGRESQKPDPNAVSYLIRTKTGEKIILNDSVLRIGRNKKYVDYCIENNQTIGRSHADIVKTSEGYKIIDNNSKNHTYVENVIVSSDEPVILKHGDRIVLSNEEFIFYLY